MRKHPPNFPYQIRANIQRESDREQRKRDEIRGDKRNNEYHVAARFWDRYVIAVCRFMTLSFSKPNPLLQRGHGGFCVWHLRHVFSDDGIFGSNLLK